MWPLYIVCDCQKRLGQRLTDYTVVCLVERLIGCTAQSPVLGHTERTHNVGTWNLEWTVNNVRCNVLTPNKPSKGSWSRQTMKPRRSTGRIDAHSHVLGNHCWNFALLFHLSTFYMIDKYLLPGSGLAVTRLVWSTPSTWSRMIRRSYSKRGGFSFDWQSLSNQIIAIPSSVPFNKIFEVRPITKLTVIVLFLPGILCSGGQRLELQMWLYE